MTLLGEVRACLRLKTDAFDGEITGLIAACKADLSISGVRIVDEADPLIIRCIILYSKANFGSAADSEKFQNAYERLRQSLSLAGDYRGCNNSTAGAG